MSKKRKAKKSKRKANAELKNKAITHDLHHIFYQGRFYRQNQSLRDLREYYYCKVYVPKDTLHQSIHAQLKNIPVPKPVNAQIALAQLKLLTSYDAIHEDDSFERRMQVILALFNCAEPATADALFKQWEIVREFYKGLS